MQRLKDILGDYNSFLKAIFQQLKEKQVDCEQFHIDLLLYQTATVDSYQTRRSALEKVGRKVSENMVNGRKVAVFGFDEPLIWEGWQIRFIEIAEPRPDQSNTKDSLSRLVFTINFPHGELLRMNPTAGFDTTRLKSSVNPEVRLKLAAGEVGFRYFSIERVIDYESNLPAPMADEDEAELTRTPERSLEDWKRILNIQEKNS